jgi:hypothetical protein
VQRLEQARQWYGLPGRRGPEDGLPGPSRGLISLEEDRVRSPPLLACVDRGGQRQEGSGHARKSAELAGRRKALKVTIPGAALWETTGRLEGEQGVGRAKEP